MSGYGITYRSIMSYPNFRTSAFVATAIRVIVTYYLILLFVLS